MNNGNTMLLVIATMMLTCGLIFGSTYAIHRIRKWKLSKLRDLFFLRREWLEADFLTRASETGKPRGLEWIDCEFADEVTFARDRSTGELRALVGVTISFRAIEGGGMEHVEAVGNLRSATAVFHSIQGKWETDGRAIFNLDPHQTIRHFQHELEHV